MLLGSACIFIYWRTQEFYRLTKHKGIKYFRYAFLFFGLSLIVPLLMPLFRVLNFPRGTLLFIMVFIGTAAILLLLYSVLWKRIKLPLPLTIIFALSALLSITTLLGKLMPLTIGVHIILFATAVIISYSDAKRKSQHKLQLHILYLRLFISWVLNAGARFAIHIALLLSPILNILSMALFLFIAYRVWQTTGGK